MFGLAALAYGVITSFVMASLSRNRRAARSNPPMLSLFAWVLAGFSLGAAMLMIGYVGYKALSGNAA